MIQIRKEAQDIMDGNQPKDNNVLKNAPHPTPVMAVSDAEWNRYADHTIFVRIAYTGTSPYTRQTAAFPLPWLLEKKVWPTVARVDDGKSPEVIAALA